jgi:hypothetical protein
MNIRMVMHVHPASKSINIMHDFLRKSTKLDIHD